jgi:hypothetical protein
MRVQRIISVFLCSALLLCPIAGLAFETDQFNLPPEPLADIGSEISNYIEANVREAVASVNGDIGKSLACLENPGKDKTCGSRESEQVRLAKLRSDEAIVNEVYKRLGDGTIFRSKFGKWFNSHDFQMTPSKYKTDYLDSIYVALPANYWTISPTIDLYGVQFGTDKLEHFFQQGYRYHQIERDAAAKGEEPAKAGEKAVKWGQKTERTFYGLLVSGVYSNADLYANYAGMKFYDGLTRPVNIGSSTRPALIVQNDGRWNINEEISLSDNLLKPFITEHLNEALNPSGYAFTIFASVKQVVRKNACPEWRKQYPDLTADALDRKASELELWNEQDYGNMEKGRFVRLSEVCFAN